MADALEGRKLITEATRQAVHGKRNLDPYDKVTMLMGPVKGKVEHNPELILKLIDAFRSCKLNELVEELEERMLHCVIEDCFIYIIDVFWQAMKCRLSGLFISFSKGYPKAAFGFLGSQNSATEGGQAILVILV